MKLNFFQTLERRTILVTGASRGIGREIAKLCAKDGANVVLLARSHTQTSHTMLEGTVEEVATEIKNGGGSALPLQVDLQDSVSVKRVVSESLRFFGGIDAIVNNASAIDVQKVPSMNKYDLMMNVNARGTANMILESYPSLMKSDLRQVVTISPPLETLSQKWLEPHPMYTTSKYAMTMITLGYADQLRANTIWPKKLLATAATKMLEEKTKIPGFSQGLPPESFAKVVHNILCSDVTGLSCLDDDISPVSRDGVDDIFIS